MDNVKSIRFDQRRWSLHIHVTFNDGTEKEWVASADSGVTYGDCIFFGTRAQYDEAVES
jgi:ribosomal protein L2